MAKRSIPEAFPLKQPALPPDNLPIAAIIRAVEICRSHSGCEGARDRWGWHPLHQAAVSSIEEDW